MIYLRYTILILLLIISMSFMGGVVFWILENIFKMSFDNILYSGIKAGLMSSIILIFMEIYSKKKKRAKTLNYKS